MKKIKLHNSNLNTLVDDDIYELIKDKTLYRNQGGRSDKIYALFYEKGKHILLHRFIMDVHDTRMIDHKNDNSLDNRRCNLRIATKSQNMMNKGIKKDNTSGYKGVSFNTHTKSYQSYIWLNRKKKSLGYFKTPEEAAIAYNKAAPLYHGEFAYLNNIEKRSKGDAVS